MSNASAKSASARRLEILEAALRLLAEEGYAGASLRKLAKRLGIAQPSLYHYFATKEDLVEQVLAYYAGQMYSALPPGGMPTTLEQLPRFIARTTVATYDRPVHPLFVRVAVSVSRVNPRFGTVMRRVFVDNANWGIQQIMRPFVQAGEIDEANAHDLVRMIINAIALRLIEDRVMFADQEPGPDFDRFVDFVVGAAERWIEGLPSRRGSPNSND